MSDPIESFKQKVRRVVAGDRATIDRDDLTPAAVLVPFVFRDDEPRVIFTKRTMNVAKHKGQISFPGGMAEPDDGDPTATALRESHEEIGLDPSMVEVIGALDDHITTTGFAVTPVVGFVSPDAELAPDPVEVDEVFEVPVDRLMDPSHHDVEVIERRGTSFQNHRYFVDGGRVIWGATGRIIAGLVAALEEV
jgi:8-oxo-dGTP pyrophosphatase MutT (NUDIX family)